MDAQLPNTFALAQSSIRVSESDIVIKPKDHSEITFLFTWVESLEVIYRPMRYMLRCCMAISATFLLVWLYMGGILLSILTFVPLVAGGFAVFTIKSTRDSAMIFITYREAFRQWSTQGGWFLMGPCSPEELEKFKRFIMEVNGLCRKEDAC